MKPIRQLTLFLFFLSLFIWTPLASAHRPGSASDGVTEIPNIVTSFAYYQELETADQVDQYTFTAAAGDFFHAGVNVPAIAGLESYGVSLALVGPGLPPLPPDSLPEVAADHHHDTDVAEHEHAPTGLVLPSVRSEDFYEPFTQTNYWSRQTLELDLPESGAYTLLIWNPEEALGKYVLDTGTKEVFGPADLFRFPIWWVDVHAYFGHTPYIVAVGLGLVVLVGWWLRRRYGRSQTPLSQKNQESFA